MKKLLLFTTLLLVPFFASAQQLNAERAASRTTFINQGGHWFITASGGVGHLFSERSGELELFDNIQPTVGLSIGKWVSPVWGLRLNATGAKLQGYTPWNENTGNGIWYNGTKHANIPYYIHANHATKDLIKNTFLGDAKESKNGEDGYLYDVPYAAGSIDLLVNLNNLFGSYSDSRVFNFILFGGLGYSHTFKDEDLSRTSVNNMMGKGGFIADFSVSRAVSISLEGQALVLPEMFDRQVGGKNTHDIVANAMLGLSYKFSPRKFEKARLYDPNEVAGLNDQINKLRSENNELRKRPEYCADCAPCPKCPEVVVKETVKFDYLPSPVFFRISSSVIDDAQWKSIEDAVKYLKENPNAKLKVTGYADKATGTAAGNKKLSEKRAKAVYDAMVNKYGINPTRIETSFLGDDVQPFTENDWNRVVVFVKD